MHEGQDLVREPRDYAANFKFRAQPKEEVDL